MLVLFFLLVWSGRARPPELGARKAWEPGSDRLDSIADETILDSTSKVRTQCFSGNEKYLKQMVLCDRECLKDVEAVVEASGGGSDEDISKLSCAGPWYCSRTEICETFRQESRDRYSAFERSCTVVYGCANHSQCFPTVDQMRRMKIDMHLTDFSDEDAEEIRDDGFALRYGGITATTTCCVNNRGRQSTYRLFISQPCNSAAGLRTTTFSTTLVVLVAVASAAVAFARDSPLKDAGARIN